MRLENEEQILDEKFRQQVLKEITEGTENKSRKQEAKRAYDLFKDRTGDYVLEALEREMGEKALKNIQDRVSNISFCRAVIEKKARVYKDGVTRTVTDEVFKDGISKLEDLLNVNYNLKRVNKFTELQKNALLQVMPVVCHSTGAWKLKLMPLNPFAYDVIEDSQNPEEARIVIFSYFNAGLAASQSTNPTLPNQTQIHPPKSNNDTTNSFRYGDRTDQIIADAPIDQGSDKPMYIWWSNKYHFTTDEKGAIVTEKSPENLLNPIGMLPFVNYAKDQDGHFWAEGGRDLLDGSIQLNKLLTELAYVTKFQGMGLFYMFGRGVPENITVGPAEVLTLKMEEGDPTPQIGFASANPPIGDHLEEIKETLGYMLSTNGLDAGSISGNVSATNTKSGIHEILKRSNVIDEIKDQQQLYIDKEREMWKIIFSWLKVYRDAGQLDAIFSEVPDIPLDTSVQIRFGEPEVITTEMEKLEIIEKRRELNLDTKVDSILRDNSDLTELEAREKLEKIEEENAQEMTFNITTGGDDGEGEDSEVRPQPDGQPEN